MYGEIFNYISHVGVYPGAQYNKHSDHPMGAKCSYNHETPRYCWLNFVPAMFNTKSRPDSLTLEFRSASGTLNFTKVSNWLKICIAFVYFADNHQQYIIRGGIILKGQQDDIPLPITLENVLRVVYPKTHLNLIDYVRDRTAKFNGENRDGYEKNEYRREKLEDMKELKIKELIC